MKNQIFSNLKKAKEVAKETNQVTYQKWFATFHKVTPQGVVSTISYIDLLQEVL
jgi:hypothetical protein